MRWARDRERAGDGRESFGARADIVRIFRISLLSLLYAGLCVAAIAALSRDLKAFLGAACVSVVTPGLLYALRRGRPRLAMTSAVSMLLVVACYEVSLGDGIHDVGVSLFTVVALVSALLLDRRSAWMFSALSVLCVAVIGGAELTGYLTTPHSYDTHAGVVAILVCLLGTFAVLIHAVTQALYAGLEQAALSEQTYREIFNATSDGIFIHDVDRGTILDVNESACAMSGFTRGELIGKSLGDLSRAGVGQVDVPALEARLRRARDGEPQTFEWRALRKDATAAWLEVAFRAAQIRGREHVLASVRDISDRKAAAEQLQAAERLNVVGQLAGGVAHDFNNQLTGIVANATLLKPRIVEDRAGQGYVDAILHCSNRAADLTRQLLAFARKGARRDQVLDVDVLVREVVSLLERSIDKRVAISLELASDGRCRVLGDPSFLGSAFLNLGLNARDAMPQGGSLVFETRCVSGSELPEAARAQLAESPQGYVRVRVSDKGVGIAPEALGRIFEPFFTTKSGGHGLGLSAAYGTVHAHRGVMLVKSTLGVGTRFELYLPATDQRPEPAHEPRTSQPLPALRVLLAEDERSVGHATELLLQELGCVVKWCRDGRAALDAFEFDADGFDVVMLDHSMPRMLGSEVAQRIAELRPQLPIIATSGFAEGTPDLAQAKRIFLPKPFDADQLKAALAQASARAR